MAEKAMEAISDAAKADIPLQISPVTAWEIGLMARKGRFRSSLSPQRWFDRLRTLPGVAICSLAPEVLLASSFLPGELHGDPADRMMVATANPFIRVEEGPRSVHVTYREREWLFPREDCVLLPIENTTAELLARYIGQRLLADLAEHHGYRPELLRVEVEENIGQSATYEWRA